MIARLGIMGGMFDPVHNGHVAAAEYARRNLGLDLVRMVPCNMPNHRGRARANGAHRLQMLELATENNAAIEVDAIEIKRPGISYSVDTLTAYHEAKLAEQIIFVIGIDSFNTLPDWHEWPRLFEFCHFFVLGRSGVTVDAATAQALNLKERRVYSAGALFTHPEGHVLVDTRFSKHGSSSQVRELLRAGGDVSHLIDPKVLLYIEDNRLYR